MQHEFHRCIINGDIRLLKHILEQVPREELLTLVNSTYSRNGSPALSNAIGATTDPLSMKLVQELLKVKGIDVNRANRMGNTPLMKAVMRGNEKIVKRLLGVPGIDVHRRNQRGQTAVSMAIKHKRWSILDVLLDLLLDSPTPRVHADVVNAPDEKGNNSLMRALQKNDIDLARSILTRSHIDLDHRNHQEKNIKTFIQGLKDPRRKSEIRAIVDDIQRHYVLQKARAFGKNTVTNHSMLPNVLKMNPDMFHQLTTFIKPSLPTTVHDRRHLQALVHAKKKNR